VIDRNQIGADVKRMLDPADGKWEGAAAMRERDAQSWEPFEHTAEHHRTNRERTFCRHTDQPRYPIFRHSFRAHHVACINKNGAVQHRGALPNSGERGIIEISSIGTVAIVVT